MISMQVGDIILSKRGTVALVDMMFIYDVVDKVTTFSSQWYSSQDCSHGFWRWNGLASLELADASSASCVFVCEVAYLVS